MFSTDEISRSTGAAWALFKGDPQGLRQLDLSFSGFWRSFGVIVLILPAFGIALAAERQHILAATPVDAETFPASAFLVASLVTLILDWLDYPILLALLARPLGLQRTYVPLIVALNWAQLLAVLPIVAPSLLYLLGIIGYEAEEILMLIGFGVVLRYQFVITRIATGAPVGFVAGLVVLDLVSGMLVRVLVQAVVGI
ncbi:hypothetical protein [Chthonobacter albigriseus]|uniref:hypothetical protein n=1 Tax=Chthonobacter albigriseus TaxID=1683161 RepID=UPI0015EEC203|nr:hypothetical protein [Chthonobacter albigriseus]